MLNDCTGILRGGGWYRFMSAPSRKLNSVALKKDKILMDIVLKALNEPDKKTVTEFTFSLLESITSEYVL